MGGSFVPEPGLVGPPPSCTGTNSASNRDSHSESATTKEHRRFFVTSLKFTHGDNTWHLYTISFLMGKPQTDSSKKRQEQRVFLQPLFKEMLQFSETIDPAGQHVKAKVKLQNVHRRTDSLTRLCARANGMSKTRYPNESVKDVLDFRQ